MIQPTAPKNIKNLQKPLDKQKNLCYNIDTIKEGGTDSDGFLTVRWLLCSKNAHKKNEKNT
jgi:hypothetical protein